MIGAETDVEVEPVSDGIFAAINATIQGAAVVPPEAPMQPAGAGADDPADPPAHQIRHAGGSGRLE
jgi:hypothetical protein